MFPVIQSSSLLRSSRPLQQPPFVFPLPECSLELWRWEREAWWPKPAINESSSHPLQDTLSALQSTFSESLLHQVCHQVSQTPHSTSLLPAGPDNCCTGRSTITYSSYTHVTLSRHCPHLIVCHIYSTTSLYLKYVGKYCRRCRYSRSLQDNV